MRSATDPRGAAASYRPIDFDGLRCANVARCEDVFHPVQDWSPTDWACAFAGEAGEACNLVKKLRRQKPQKGVPEELVQKIGEELADTIIYADLLAARLGIDLGLAVQLKFNEVSEELGSEVLL